MYFNKVTFVVEIKVGVKFMVANFHRYIYYYSTCMLGQLKKHIRSQVPMLISESQVPMLISL